MKEGGGKKKGKEKGKNKKEKGREGRGLKRRMGGFVLLSIFF